MFLISLNFIDNALSQQSVFISAETKNYNLTDVRCKYSNSLRL